MAGGIRAIAGLGNPGPGYEHSRHNAGADWVRALARAHRASWRREPRFFGDLARLDTAGSPVWLLVPETYMNRSGQAVAPLLRFHRVVPAELLVVHDELDLPPGTVRLKRGGGHGGHNGLRDIMQAPGGAQDFGRFRTGFRHPGGGAHLAGPYNMAGAMRVPQAIAGYQFFVPFIITAWQKVYGNIYSKPEDVFKPPYASGINDLLPAVNGSYTKLVTDGKLPGGTPDQARDALIQPAFLQTMLTDDKAPINAAAQTNTLFGWKPKAPVLLCGGAGDPTVPPAVHQAPMVANFAGNGVTVQSVDVDALIQSTFGPGGKAPTDPASPEFAAYYGAYHGSYEPPFCLAAARGLFNQVR